MSKILNYLGLSRKAGFLEVGEESTGAAARGGKARLILLASDASDNALRRAQGFSGNSGAFLLTLPLTKEEISIALGKRGCSMAAVTDAGFAARIAAEIYSVAPSEYCRNAAYELSRRHEKISRRRREGNKGPEKIYIRRKKQ